MDLYTGVWLARVEHEQIVHSLPTVPEHGYQVEQPQRGTWLRRAASGRAALTAIIHLIMR